MLHRPIAGGPREQWCSPSGRASTERELWVRTAVLARALKQALVQLSLDVLNDATTERRRESSRGVVRSARGLDALARDLGAGGLPLAAELSIGLEQMCRAAAAAGAGPSAAAGSLSALRLSYRTVRAALQPCLPCDLVAEGLPVAIGGRP